MPSIMGAIDAIWEDAANSPDNGDKKQHRQTPKRAAQAHAFVNLSPNVQKILSNVPDEELAARSFGSEESLLLGGSNARRNPDVRRSIYKKRPSPPPPPAPPDSSSSSVEFSPNVRKMLSNLPDAELVKKSVSVGSLLQDGGSSSRGKKLPGGHSVRSSKSFASSTGSTTTATFLHSTFSSNGAVANRVVGGDGASIDNKCDNEREPKPLGSYLHKSGIASRTPAGRKNVMGKYQLQVPGSNDSATSGNGSSSSTTPVSSSEVSRPVSLTSLGSCSSSSSGGGGGNERGSARSGERMTSSCSAYLASAESLDSDPESTTNRAAIERAFPAGSADSGIAEQPTMSAEQCVLQEVVDTETLYVSDLRQVIEGYLEPWRSDPDCPIREHLDDLFSNLVEIYDFNRSFLEELRQANCDPTLTANVFLHNNSGFSVYTEYCTNYPRTMTVLCELIGDDSTVGLFRERQSALGHALPLGSYLLKPVQRILKYHLLLQRLSKQCEQPHKSTVDLALATMTGVASHINTMKRKHEHAVRVQEIQAQLYGWPGPDLTALGELIAEGTFRVAGARARRHIFLFDKLLLIAKSKQDGSLAYKCHIACSNLMLVEQVRGEPLSFHIIPFDNPRQQVTLRARSPQHKREWTLQLKRVILENYSAVIPNHARQLVMQLGQNLYDNPEHNEEASSDKWSPVKQHSTPQYLERRGRFRKSATGHFVNSRSASQDRSFVSLASWRRKSEPGTPGVINQYTSKTLPKRISRLRKSSSSLKHQDVPLSTCKFYTDLSDDDLESTDSLNRLVDTSANNRNTTTVDNDEEDESEEEGGNNDGKLADVQKDSHKNAEEEDVTSEKRLASSTLEKVVSDLLMQNVEINKLLSRQHSRKGSREKGEPYGNSSPSLRLEERDTTTNKADSLPRDFQLNDQFEFKKGEGNSSSVKKSSSDDLAMRFAKARHDEHEIGDLTESDLLSSRINANNEHPDHKIYRKSAIRFSLVQRFRAIISEDNHCHQKVQQQQRKMDDGAASEGGAKSTKHSMTYKRCSKSVGARIAHPDYADPQKFFHRASQIFSRSNASINSTITATTNMPTTKSVDNSSSIISFEDCIDDDFPVVDLSLDEREVLDCGEQKGREFEMSRLCEEEKSCTNAATTVASQYEGFYYEEAMEKSLSEEEATIIEKVPPLPPNKRPIIKVPPPPIPQKPTRLVVGPKKKKLPLPEPPAKTNNNNTEMSSICDSNRNCKEGRDINQSLSTVGTDCSSNGDEAQSRQGWVKTIVERFE